MSVSPTQLNKLVKSATRPVIFDWAIVVPLVTLVVPNTLFRKVLKFATPSLSARSVSAVCASVSAVCALENAVAATPFVPNRSFSHAVTSAEPNFVNAACQRPNNSSRSTSVSTVQSNKLVKLATRPAILSWAIWVAPVIVVVPNTFVRKVLKSVKSSLPNALAMACCASANARVASAIAVEAFAPAAAIASLTFVENHDAKYCKSPTLPVIA